MTLTSLILVITLALQITSAPATVVPPSDVRKSVTPILDLCARTEKTQADDHDEQVFEYGRMVGALFQTKTKSADEALVVLMDFYIGESLGDDLLHQVTKRGKRMLPLLMKYRTARIVFPEREYPSSLLVSPEVKRENSDSAIKSVKAGKVIGED
jgi:hypothetical protein